MLVGDVSRSIDRAKYKLMKDGYAAALTDARVLAAITGGPYQAIAAAYVEFAGAGEMRTVLEWAVLRDAATVGAFVAKLVDAPRSYVGHTAIGDAVAFARQLLADAGFPGARQVIDVCGDGTNNSGGNPHGGARRGGGGRAHGERPDHHQRARAGLHVGAHASAGRADR